MDWAIAAAAAGVDQTDIMDAAMVSPGRTSYERESFVVLCVIV
jgi:hypothetical protein